MTELTRLRLAPPLSTVTSGSRSRLRRVVGCGDRWRVRRFSVFPGAGGAGGGHWPDLGFAVVEQQSVGDHSHRACRRVVHRGGARRVRRGRRRRRPTARRVGACAHRRGLFPGYGAWAPGVGARGGDDRRAAGLGRHEFGGQRRRASRGRSSTRAVGSAARRGGRPGERLRRWAIRRPISPISLWRSDKPAPGDQTAATAEGGRIMSRAVYNGDLPAGDKTCSICAQLVAGRTGDEPAGRSEAESPMSSTRRRKQSSRPSTRPRKPRTLLARPGLASLSGPSSRSWSALSRRATWRPSAVGSGTKRRCLISQQRVVAQTSPGQLRRFGCPDLLGGG